MTPHSTQRCLAALPHLLQHQRQIVHRGERVVVLGAQQPLEAVQGSAPQWLGLGEGAAGHQHPAEPQVWIATGAEKSPRLCERRTFFDFAVSWHVFGSKSLVGKQNFVFQIVLMSLEQLL